MDQERKKQEEWYQKAIRALEFAISENARQLDEEEDEAPPTKESIAEASAFLNEVSEKLSTVAIAKVSISCNGTITLRWKVSDGRIDVAFSGSSVQAHASSRSENKDIEKSEVPGRVLALLT